MTYEHPSFTAAKKAPEPWRTHFPKNTEEAKAFVPHVRMHSLASQVLAVARTRIEFGWAAYVDAVPGYNHLVEKEAVLTYGCKLRENIARLLFPEFDSIPYIE